MIIVAGHLEVDPGNRAAYLENSHEVVRGARGAEGCRDFAMSADVLDPGRINIFERWDSVDAVEAFRGSGPSDDQVGQILTADVQQFEVTDGDRLM